MPISLMSNFNSFIYIPHVVKTRQIKQKYLFGRDSLFKPETDVQLKLLKQRIQSPRLVDFFAKEVDKIC